MKKISFLFLFSVLSFLTNGQEITGQWNGVLSFQSIELRLIIHITQESNGYSATLDSPDQGANGLPASSVDFKNDSLFFSINNLGVAYQGLLGTDEIIKGTFTQNGQSLPLNLSREEIAKKEIKRPQEPTEPYPYYVEDLIIQHQSEDHQLAATLTLPNKDGSFPVAILISGSGPQNRNEELLNHKPFLVIADYLTRNGIGVLRFDDRGVAQSTGNFEAATSADFATDVESIIHYLKTRADIDTSQIGLIGHSEGGLIAPMVAAESDDVAFIVMLAGPGVSGYDILLAQSRLISAADGTDQKQLDLELDLLQGALDIIKSENDPVLVKEKVSDYLKARKSIISQIAPSEDIDTYIRSFAEQTTSPWYQFFISYDPGTSLRQTTCAVLALNGDKDLQVPADMNLSKIEEHLKAAGNANFTIKSLSNLNHLFQECSTGSPSEYADIEQTFSPTALALMKDWIIEQVK